MKSGKLVILCGPSGSGKSSVEKYFLFDKKYNFHFSVSATSRKSRENEIDGVNYFFLATDEFEKMIAKKQFLEWAKFIGNYYGTPLAPIKRELAKGNNVFLEIELLGVEQVLKKLPDTITIFLTPPSLEILKTRLEGRGTEDKETIEKRINRAIIEIEAQELFKYTVINNNIKVAAEEIRAILDKELEV